MNQKIQQKKKTKKLFGLLENIRDMDLLYQNIFELIPSIKKELKILKKY